MSDRELLELAAKAAGIHWRNWTKTMFLGETELREWPYDWNPLIDDGDALRLAVKLRLHIRPLARCTDVDLGAVLPGPLCREHWRNDQIAATRRAIVRAAAEIGRAAAPAAKKED